MVNENLPADAGINEVKIFMNNQRNDILLYLPAALHMGELLNDKSLDDETNKMGGLLSSLMKRMGAAFSAPVSDAEIKK